MLSFETEDGSQVEVVRVLATGMALRANGYLVHVGEGAYGASYSVVVDNEGRSRRMTVRCDDAGGERSMSLTRSPGGPWLAEGAGGAIPMPELDDAQDIYLGGSAFVASLAIRRLGLHQTSADVHVTVASISLPSLAVKAVEHRGRTESLDPTGARIAYSGSFGDREILVDSDGLYLSSPGLATRLG